MSSSSAGLNDLVRRDLDPEDPTNAIQDELYSSWALLILVTLLIATLWMSYYLQLKKIRAFHETVVSIFGGTLTALLEFLAHDRDDCWIDYSSKSRNDDSKHGLVQVFGLLQFPSSSYYSQLWI
jgi:hypothetical protein